MQTESVRAFIFCFGLAALASCGGRVAQPVTEHRSYDEQLRCKHIVAEAEVNFARRADLLGEADAANDRNAQLLFAAPLSIAFPLFIDLTDTEKEEVAALDRRNLQLAAMAREQGCLELLPQVPVSE